MRSLHDALPILPAAAAPAEQPFENIAEIGAGVSEAAVRARVAAKTTASAAIAERHGGIAVAVDLAAIILRALRLVGQQVIGLGDVGEFLRRLGIRSEEHTSELQSLMRISYAVFCLKKKNKVDTRLITITIQEYRV